MKVSLPKTLTLGMLQDRLATIRQEHQEPAWAPVKVELNGMPFQLNTGNFTVGDDGTFAFDLCLPNAAVAAIQYVLEHPCESPMEFLRCWNEGNFAALRAEWPAVPAEVFIGADPLYKNAGGDE
ncbi:hypothetical protein CSV86_018125 [Pseudomonas putida CSV86]|uniref:Uncharacterized protein n=1 Tax=Pseudomonas bharatica CSV86 TaxID=1005395 RepID=L1M0Z7_9PSED|nr:hypothetical protein [Pseudomonas bharatica]NNJ16981.1 hypothetical protein [Pseudomonas bharatica CSV86]